MLVCELQSCPKEAKVWPGSFLDFSNSKHSTMTPHSYCKPQNPQHNYKMYCICYTKRGNTLITVGI